MVSYTRTLMQGVATISIITGLTTVVGYFIRLVLARNLSIGDFGLFYAVLSFVSFFYAFRNLGMGSALSKYLPELIAKKDFKSAKYAILSTTLIQFLFTGAIALILVLLAPYLSRNFFHTTEATFVVLFLVLSFLFNAVQEILTAIFSGFQKFFYMSSLEFLKTTFILLVLFFVLSYTKTALAPAFSYFLVSLLIPFLFIFLFFKVFPQFSRTNSSFNLMAVLRSFFSMKTTNNLVQKMRNFGFFVFVNAQGEVLVYSLDVVALTFFRSLDEVGLYSAAVPLATLITFFSTSLIGLLVPVISDMWTRNKKDFLRIEINRMRKYLLMIVLPIALSLFAFSDVAIRVVFGEKFVAAAYALKILVVGVVFYTLAVMNKEVLNGIGQPKTNSKLVFIAAACNLMLILLFTKQYGMIAVAFSTSISYILLFLMNSFALNKFIKAKSDVGMYAKLIISGLAFLGMIYLIKAIELNFWPKLALSIVLASGVYVLLLFILKIVSLDEINLIKKRLAA